MLSRLSPVIAAMAMLIPSLATAEEAAAQAAPDAVLEALSAELERARVLLDALEPAPYFISIQAIEQERVGIVGEEGGLQGWAPSRGRWVHADVRLGTPELDSTHALRDGSYDEGGTGGRALPVGDDPAVLQLAVWEEVDVAYRAAVERMERVEADRQILVEEETFFDLAPVEAFVDVAEIPGMDVDIDVWEATIRRASAVFAESQVAIDPSVSLSVDRDTRWFVSTEGAKIRTTARRARVDISADTVANDGSWLSVHEAFDAESPAGLPSPDELADAVRQSVRDLAALREAPEEEPFVGPAILSGRASAVFFHEIFGHRVEGHRLKQVSDAQTFRNRIGEEILPSFLSVHDDPTLPQYVEQDLRGHYDFDDQGVRAERVPLVEAGVLKGFLQSRSTVGEGALSNAHGRRQPGVDPVARQGNLIVSSTLIQSDEQLRAALIAKTKAAGLPHGLIIDDIEGGFTFTDRDIPNAFQIDVRVARRVFVDGRPDELVRGIDLIGTPLTTFAMIEGVGPTPEVFNGTCGAESGWVPVSAASPALLIREIETQRKGKAQELPPLLAPPSGNAPVASVEGGDLLLAVLEAESERALAELRPGGAPPPSRVVMRARDHHAYSVRADFGVLSSESGWRSRPTDVEVVIGDDRLNSSRFAPDAGIPLPSSVQRPRLVIDDTAAALARDLWISTDAGYKVALQRFLLKSSAYRDSDLDELVPDWTDAPPVVYIDDGPRRAPDDDRLRTLAVEASARLRGIPGLRSGRVVVGADFGRDYLVSTEGHRVVQSDAMVAVYAVADAVDSAGVRYFDRLQWVVETEADLPSVAAISDAVEAMGRSVSRRVLGGAVSFYEGPVLFEGEAALDLFRYLVPPEVQGTPPTPEGAGSYQRGMKDAARLGRRLLPRGWTIEDDPTAVPDGLPGGYRYDREGVAAASVRLVDDGYVRDLAMSRVPRADLRASTGHARGAIHHALAARLVNWTVTPARSKPARAVVRQGEILAKRAQLDRVLVVRRIEQGRDGALPRPTDAVWRLLDGSEIPVSMMEFEGVDRRALRDIVAAGGPMMTRAYLAPTGRYDRAGPVRGLPTVIRAPSVVLVEEMELVYPGVTRDPATIPPPEIQ
jgi:predicted Zn-dependent protease